MNPLDSTRWIYYDRANNSLKEFYMYQHAFHYVDEHFTIIFNRINVAVSHKHGDGAPCCMWNSLVFL